MHSAVTVSQSFVSEVHVFLLLKEIPYNKGPAAQCHMEQGRQGSVIYFRSNRSFKYKKKAKSVRS